MALYKFYYYLCKPITCILFIHLVCSHSASSCVFALYTRMTRTPEFMWICSSIGVRSFCDLGVWKLILKNGVPRLPVGEKCIIQSSLVLMHYQHVTDTDMLPILKLNSSITKGTDMLPILKLHSSIPKGKGVPYPKEYRQVPNHQPWLNAIKTPVSNLHTVKPFGLQLHDWSYNNSDHNYFLHLCDTGGST